MLELAHMNESYDSYMNDDAVGVTVLKDCFVVSLSCVFPLLYYLPFLCYLHILHYSPLLYSSLSFILPSLVFLPLLYYLPLLYSLPLLHDFPLLLLPLLYSLLESRRRCHLNTARCACVETLYILHCYTLFVSYMLYILHSTFYIIFYISEIIFPSRNVLNDEAHASKSLLLTTDDVCGMRWPTSRVTCTRCNWLRLWLWFWQGCPCCRVTLAIAAG